MASENFDPRVDSGSQRLAASVKILIAGGFGVGKTTISVNLAIALAQGIDLQRTPDMILDEVMAGLNSDETRELIAQVQAIADGLGQGQLPLAREGREHGAYLAMDTLHEGKGSSGQGQPAGVRPGKPPGRASLRPHPLNLIR